ncbi:hypothetical protein Sme01_31190 [Sphaerisporangium melleum]|nr:hypothetical protein Sme01_31190 [Sphaerisporangium melleum]
MSITVVGPPSTVTAHACRAGPIRDVMAAPSRLRTRAGPRLRPREACETISRGPGYGPTEAAPPPTCPIGPPPTYTPAGGETAFSFTRACHLILSGPR